MTRFLLDSGDPDEYREFSHLIWGATTNPSLIAKKLESKKISQEEAFELQKKIVLEIIAIVPGAVSAEVYADGKTTHEQMIRQGEEIATWHKRIVVKLPTTIEGFKARTKLRQDKITVNNTLVFSQEQIFAICLHEKLIQEAYRPFNPPAHSGLSPSGSKTGRYPSFISPFVGRLDDINEDGMSLVENGMKIKKALFEGVPHGTPWMLEASVRKVEHIRRGILAKTELITAPAKVYKEWFALSKKDQEKIDPVSYSKGLQKPALWKAPKEILQIDSIDEFYKAISSDALNIKHPLTDKGLIRFASDWNAIIA